MNNSTEVKQFYDNFTDTRMVQYKLYGNPRIDKAVELISSYLSPDSNILDIGCGIGIVPEQIATQLKQGRILACDLSENNINYARQTIESDKIEFFNVNVIENFDAIRKKLTTPIDLVTIVDVIEHLPPNSYDGLFNNLAQITSEQAKLILTYPSREFQTYLREHNPGELQIIDEVIEVSHLMQFALKYGFNLEYFAYIDVWKKNQYIHCVFSKQRPCIPVSEPGILEKIKGKIKSYKSRLLLPFLKRKYIDRVNQSKK
ncbi:bifunctional 2-polyprenyl-6-hydroxyphenol methylase/3-demethylubiquinol 3-O-methyltransferase UbiG [Pleurocapsa sp. PCC 7319]|uniref:class I SAM-dependent methyltransferase n=1 Tax=Pleurocapsa sp. PCC 7319 TaxID=118161 RepID=UPI000349F7E4|nr:class I SAM-dependent methyltransferase [Pleurocapsa sp. PCC 7319]